MSPQNSCLSAKFDNGKFLLQTYRCTYSADTLPVPSLLYLVPRSSNLVSSCLLRVIVPVWNMNVDLSISSETCYEVLPRDAYCIQCLSLWCNRQCPPPSLPWTYKILKDRSVESLSESWERGYCEVSLSRFACACCSAQTNKQTSLGRVILDDRKMTPSF